MIDDIQGIVIDLREMAPKRHSFVPNVPHILEVAADVIEAQEARIKALEKALTFYKVLGGSLKTSYSHGEAKTMMLSDGGNVAPEALTPSLPK